ncbi:hypothetical protein [Oceanobacillus timonensis]|uniref:hypothetical protein n=1 Tax=Oceanobacillus timonensis TaxID=1926285 RepID=UPI0015C4D9F6|nr:hypothetical protein [Oceanobacillus timonensis]
MMRMIFIFAMMLSAVLILLKWRYKIINSMLNWEKGRKYLVPMIGNIILRKKEKEAV